MRDLKLDLTRKSTKLSDIQSRIAHKKECKTSVTRVRNKIINAIELAYDFLRKGELKSELPCECIQDESRLRAYLQKIRENGIYVLDMESTGLDIFNDIIVGVCLYTPQESPVYIPINHTDLDNNRLSNQLNEELVKNLLEPIITSENIKTITHNGKYDGKLIKWNWGYGIKNFYFDTQISSHLMNEEEPHGLKPLYNKYILKGQGNSFDYNDYFSGIPFNYIPLEVATVYGANDGIKTYKLYEFYDSFFRLDREDMKKLSHVFYDIEMPLYPVLIDMELRGVEIDKDYAKSLEVEMVSESEELERDMDSILSEIREDILKHEVLNRLTRGVGKVNYSSPEQLASLFYDVLKMPRVNRKKGKERSTGKEDLAKMMDRTKNETLKVFIEKLLRYKGLTKLTSTYVIKMPNAVEPKTGRLHGEFVQTGTVTGRFSSKNPNLQNIPSKEKRIRKMFKAREGYLLVGSDYSQIEPRTLAQITAMITKDITMKEAYIQERDLYVMMASKIYNLPEEECVEFRPDGSKNPDGAIRRNSVKSVLLGIMYERSPEDIASQFSKPKKWGYDIVDLFKKQFPKVELCRQYFISHAETYGFISTIDGRKRRLPDMKLNKKNWKYKNAHRQVLNAVIQGTAGDIMKKAMVRIGHDKRLKELDAHILITVHDELILEVKEENVKEATQRLTQLMKEVGQETLGGIPMKCDAEICTKWYGEDLYNHYFQVGA